mgnify:CR=1 FL=1
MDLNDVTIIIDGIDIQNISLKLLREKISILPQEQFLIESSLRDNIDPLKKYNDEDILKLIDDLCLFQKLDNISKLNFEIKENGKNLSTGEKKLICFARTIIRNNKKHNLFLSVLFIMLLYYPFQKKMIQ